MTDQADLFESATREIPLAEALGERYLAYALSTITARSLPDMRDGLKPVHRRLLFAMRQLRLDPGHRVQEMRPRGRRRHGQVPSARRPGDLRRDGADGAGLRRALSAGRGAREFRQYRRRRRGGHALHRGPADALRARSPRRNRRGRGRFPPQLRRHRRRAGGAAGERSKPALQRRKRYRRGHGDQHPAAQPRRGVRRRAPSDRTPRCPEREAGRSGARARLSDRRRPRRAAFRGRGGLRRPDAATCVSGRAGRWSGSATAATRWW